MTDHIIGGGGGTLRQGDFTAACQAVRVVVSEMHAMLGSRLPLAGRKRRRSLCHVRQIAMYVCHVVLQVSLTDIGLAYGRDRTTVGHACRVIEDRRDDQGYDDFVSAVERVVAAAFGVEANPHDAA